MVVSAIYQEVKGKCGEGIYDLVIARQLAAG
jgi:hypothetical protein